MADPIQTLSLEYFLALKELPHPHHLARQPRHFPLSPWARHLKKNTQESSSFFTITARKIIPSLGIPMTSFMGFTLVEMVLGLLLIAVLSGIAIPTYSNFREKTDITQATIDIQQLGNKVLVYKLDKLKLPNTLAEAGLDGLNDPWGNPYQYLNIADGGKAKARKDKFLVPLNSDYDLYSMGKDGLTKAPLTAKASWDDILRAVDGTYVGLASAF